MDAHASRARLKRHHLFGAARAEALARLGRTAEAADELEQAAALAPTQRERRLLLERAAGAESTDSSS